MISDVESLLAILFPTILFALLFFLAYKRYIFSIYDPLTLFVVEMSFSSVLMITTVSNALYLFQFFSFQFLFWLGFISVRPYAKKITNANIHYSKYNILFLEHLTMIFFFIFIVANAYYFIKVGIPILSQNPTVFKVASFEGGLGIIRRINWGMGVFIACASIVISIIGIHKKTFLSIFLILMIITSMGGAKGALLAYVFILAYMTQQYSLKNYDLVKKYKKYIGVIFVLAFIVAMTILYIENNGMKEVFFAFLNRLLYFGDVVLYYYQPDVMHYFENYTPFDYIYRLLNPIFGMFRLVPYENPLGYVMVILTLTTETLPTVMGPNSPFYIEGHLYFGLFGGMLYSFVIGFIVAFLRKKFFAHRILNLVVFIYIFVLTINILDLPMDSSYFVSKIFDTFLFTLPIVIIYYIVFQSVKKSKRQSNNKEL